MQANDRMEERRRTTRTPCDLPVTWLRRGRVAIGCVRDVNADGFFLLTPETVALNQVMNLVVMLPDGPIDFFGVSRYVGVSVHGHGVGLSIHTMSHHEQARWRAFHRAALAPGRGRRPPSAPAPASASDLRRR